MTGRDYHTVFGLNLKNVVKAVFYCNSVVQGKQI